MQLSLRLIKLKHQPLGSAMTIEMTLDPVTRDLVFDGHTTYTFDPAELPEDTVERL